MKQPQFLKPLESQADVDAKKNFQAVARCLNSILGKEKLSSFQEEQLRQLSVDFRKSFIKWQQRSLSDASTFKKNMAVPLVWELLEMPIWELNQWLRNQIETT